MYLQLFMHQSQLSVTNAKRFEILDKLIEIHPKFSVISFTAWDAVIFKSSPLLAVVRPASSPLIGAMGIPDPHKPASIAANCDISHYFGGTVSVDIHLSSETLLMV